MTSYYFVKVSFYILLRHGRIIFLVKFFFHAFLSFFYLLDMTCKMQIEMEICDRNYLVFSIKQVLFSLLLCSQVSFFSNSKSSFYHLRGVETAECFSRRCICTRKISFNLSKNLDDKTVNLYSLTKIHLGKNELYFHLLLLLSRDTSFVLG